MILVPRQGIPQAGGTLTEQYKNMHREVLDDPYLPNEWNNQKTSSAYRFNGRVKSGGKTTVFTTQVNVSANGQNIVGDAANEPSIAVSPADPNIMVIGWRQFDNIASNFRQAGWAYTTDAGHTWTFPGVIEPGIFRSDPVLDCNASGKIFYNSLTNDPDYFCKVFGSTDGGVTWDSGTDAAGGDKQWMVIDRTEGPGRGNMYSTWTHYFSTCAPGFFIRSTNENQSYENCTVADGYAYWCTMAVGTRGELYIAGTNGTPDHLVVARSMNAPYKDSAVTWLPPVTVFAGGNPVGWSGVNPGGLLGQVNVDIDRSAGPGRDNVYVLASVARTSNGDPCDVVFMRSTDGGDTWSGPVRINDDATSTDYQWFGTMSVAPDGRIDAVWLDTRDSPDPTDSSALYYSYSVDQGETWSVNERISGLFDSHVGYPNQNKIGDYFDMVSDNAGAHLAWANTFNGEQDVCYSYIVPPVVSSTQPIEARMNISVYPNPADEAIFLSGVPVNSRYEIMNSLSQVVKSGIVHQAVTRIDLSDQITGIYFLQVTSVSGKSEVVKLMKQ